MSAPAPPPREQQATASAPKPVCSFDYKKFTPWDPCWEKYKDTMVATACGRPICKHHWLSHTMLECLACNQQRMPDINAAINKAVARTDPSAHAAGAVLNAINDFEKAKEEAQNKKP